MDRPAVTALVEEAAKRSGLIWVRALPAVEPPRPMWHLWRDGAAYVVTGGLEQPMPAGLAGRGARAELVVRSKDKQVRLVSLEAEVDVVAAGSADWEAVVPELLAKRLNTPDGDRAAVRWRRECTLLRLLPTGPVLEDPDNPSTASHAEPPPETSATTPVPRPWHLFGRSRRRA